MTYKAINLQTVKKKVDKQLINRDLQRDKKYPTQATVILI
jgi:hypothetical protein